jgi:hypothetical protein
VNQKKTFKKGGDCKKMERFYVIFLKRKAVARKLDIQQEVDDCSKAEILGL